MLKKIIEEEYAHTHEWLNPDLTQVLSAADPDLAWEVEG